MTDFRSFYFYYKEITSGETGDFVHTLRLLGYEVTLNLTT